MGRVQYLKAPLLPTSNDNNIIWPQLLAKALPDTLSRAKQMQVLLPLEAKDTSFSRRSELAAPARAQHFEVISRCCWSANSQVKENTHTHTHKFDASGVAQQES